ncbi:MAG: hypothetical protein ACFN4W_10730 [Segatella oris]
MKKERRNMEEIDRFIGKTFGMSQAENSSEQSVSEFREKGMKTIQEQKQQEIERIELTEVQTVQPRSSILVNDELCKQKKNPVIVGKETNPFQSSFTEEQIEILTTCINEIQLFTTCISTKILKDFFACKLKGVLKSNNNR